MAWAPLSWLVRRLDALFHFREPHRRFLARPLPEGVGYLHCLGGIAFTLILVLLVTGLLLSAYYVPTPLEAFASIRRIEDGVLFGRLIRGLHKWSAQLLAAALVGHMARVVWMRAYRHPRELNWVAGVFLLVLVMGAGFTGYLLPWNQKAYWATVVGTAMPSGLPGLGPRLVRLLRGGEEVTGATLIRFYSLHTHWLPFLTGAFLWAHFHMVKRRGIAGGL